MFESKCMNNEVTIEEYDKNLRATTKMASDNEQKLDELTRKLGVQEDELKRAIERAEMAESKLKNIEEELQTVGGYHYIREGGDIGLFIKLVSKVCFIIRWHRMFSYFN